MTLPVSLHPLRLDHTSQVITIHREQFPGARSTSLGRPFLARMVNWFVINQPGLNYVAFASDEPAGYILGAIGGYGRRLFRYALPEVLSGLSHNPKVLFQDRTYTLWSSYLRGLLPARKKQADEGPMIVKASLASIAVLSAYQGRGIGRLLIQAFEDGARGRGATSLGLSVEENNRPARRLYENCGWVLSKVSPERGTVYYTKILRSPAQFAEHG